MDNEKSAETGEGTRKQKTAQENSEVNADEKENADDYLHLIRV